MEASEKDDSYYKEEIYALMPEERHWLLDEIFDCEGLKKMEDEEFRLAVDAMLSVHPELDKPEITNPLLDPVMRNEDVEDEMKQALWHAKISLDSEVRYWLEEYGAMF